MTPRTGICMDCAYYDGSIRRHCRKLNQPVLPVAHCIGDVSQYRRKYKDERKRTILSTTFRIKVIEALLRATAIAVRSNDFDLSDLPHITAGNKQLEAMINKYNSKS